MTYSLTWLPDVLLAAGLKVAEVPGWRNHGRGEMGRVFGVLCHHTAGSRHNNMPSLDLLMKGRPNLPGPLSQLGLGRDGTYYVIAAGRANHAGKGEWMGASGNAHFIGIEAENTGHDDDQPWPVVQVDAYQRGVAAILKHAGLGSDRCAGHKEYAKGRKIDPTLDMVVFRAAVAKIMRGVAPPPTLIPLVEQVPNGRPTLRRGDTSDWVRTLQRGLGIAETGTFDAATEARVRVLQRQHQLVPDGIVGPKTWVLLRQTVAA